MRNAFKILFVKTFGKRPLGRSTRGRKDNTEMDLKVVVWEGVDWIHVAQDR
jgi:hypothetical protein